MPEKENSRAAHRVQFIVNDGIVYNKKDMLTLLRDLGHVVYYEFKGGKVISKGKGYIMRVSANSEDPTLFLSGRVYINVSVFDYIRVTKVNGQEKTLFELHGGDRVINILPDDNPRTPPPLSQSLFADKLMELGIVAEEPWDGKDDEEGNLAEDQPSN